MSLDTDDEILQDFIIEAGEILELLSDQLVQLEQSPTDTALLNAIFRGFHTIKGGAGFLSLTNLVKICHIAENVFDLLRHGKRSIDANLMDLILQAVDTINVMFAGIKKGQEPEPAEQTLLDNLGSLTTTNAATENNATTNIATPQNNELNQATPATTVAQDDLKEVAQTNEAIVTAENKAAKSTNSKNSTDDDKNLKSPEVIAEITNNKQPDNVELNTHNDKAANLENANDTITEEEFDALLDSINNASQNNTVKTENNADNLLTSNDASLSAKVVVANEAEETATTNDSDLITDDEFEALLDQLAEKNDAKVTLSATSQIEAVASVEQLSNNEMPAIEKQLPAKVEAKTTNKVEEQNITSELASSKDLGEKNKVVQDSKTLNTTIETTVRVDTNRLDQIMNMVGELVLVRNRLVKLKNNSNNQDIIKAVGTLDLVTADLQVAVMKTRMQPIKKVFGRFPRVVRDLSRSLKKDVVVEMSGEDTELDKNLVEALADPLIHLVRNSVDHGIEAPEDRVKCGKKKTGKITLFAAQEGDHIVLSIEDDGKGMDYEALRKCAIDKGLLSADSAERLSATECFDLIFIPGFSTKEEISDISGRGVGMDVVKTRITQLNGSIEIASTVGQGSKITIKLPLTLAILPTLMVMVGSQPFALPLACVNEIFDLNTQHTNMVDGQLVVIVRNKTLPLFYLRDWLIVDKAKASEHSTQHVVVVSVGTQKLGFVVDKLLGQEEVVIKALGNMLHGTPGIAGATITGDGNIAVILDIPNLLKAYTMEHRKAACL